MQRKFAPCWAGVRILLFCALALPVCVQLRPLRAVLPLIALLEDEDSAVRWQCAFALGHLRDRRAVEPLIGLLAEDENMEARGWAVAWSWYDVTLIDIAARRIAWTGRVDDDPQDWRRIHDADVADDGRVVAVHGFAAQSTGPVTLHAFDAAGKPQPFWTSPEELNYESPGVPQLRR